MPKKRLSREEQIRYIEKSFYGSHYPFMYFDDILVFDFIFREQSKYLLAIDYLVRTKNVSINTLSISGDYNILSLAVRRKNIGAIKLCLELGADIHFRNSLGQPVIHTVCKFLKVNHIKEFMRRGADINAIDYYSITPYYLSSPNTRKVLERIDPHINGRYSIFDRDSIY